MVQFCLKLFTPAKGVLVSVDFVETVFRTGLLLSWGASLDIKIDLIIDSDEVSNQFMVIWTSLMTVKENLKLLVEFI